MKSATNPGKISVFEISRSYVTQSIVHSKPHSESILPNSIVQLGKHSGKQLFGRLSELWLD